MPSRTIWGYEVPISATGLNRWPKELKQEVVRRLLEGRKVADLAEELGTSKELVRKWRLSLKPEGYSLPRVENPFAEVLVLDDQAPGPTATVGTAHALAMAEATRTARPMVVSSSRFTLNRLTFDAERDILVEDLTTLLQSMGKVRRFPRLMAARYTSPPSPLTSARAWMGSRLMLRPTSISTPTAARCSSSGQSAAMA